MIPHSRTSTAHRSLAALLIAFSPLSLLAGEVVVAPSPDADTLTAAEVAAPSIWDAERLTGDWGGIRSDLEARGIKLSLYYNHFWAWKDSGGVSPGSDDEHSGSIDFFAQVDFEKLGLIPGGEALAQVKNNWSFNLNPEVGALGQPIDDADGDHSVYIDQLYYQQNLFDKKIQVRAGYIDHQTILDRNIYANSEDVQFMNTYLDNNNATIPLTIGPAVSLFLNPNDWLSFVFSAADADARLFRSNFDTAFDGDHDYNLYFETGVKSTFSTARGPLTGHYRFGLVHDPKERAIFGRAAKENGNLRYYLSCDQEVYSEPLQTNGQGLGVFCRYGNQDGDLNFGANPTEHFLSAGAQYKGLFPHRDEDALGVAFYTAIASDERRQNHEGDKNLDRETGYEFYYRCQITPAIALSPGVQYIQQPGARTSNADAWLVAIRSRFTF